MINLSKLAGLCLASLLLSGVMGAQVVAADGLDRLRDSQVLTLGFVEGFAPFSSGSEQAPQGYSVELCKAVAAHIRQLPGLAGLQVRWRALAEPQSFQPWLRAESTCCVRPWWKPSAGVVLRTFPFRSLPLALPCW